MASTVTFHLRSTYALALVAALANASGCSTPRGAVGEFSQLTATPATLAGVSRAVDLPSSGPARVPAVRGSTDQVPATVAPSFQADPAPHLFRLPPTSLVGTAAATYVQLAAYAVNDAADDGWIRPVEVEHVEAVPVGTVPVGNVTVAADTRAQMPIDLANALAMGGASHLLIELARERVIESQAEYLEAKSLWLPSLRFGVGWTKHDGRLQAAPGTVSEISRNSLFVGGGAGLGNAPLAGGAGGPSRLAVSLSLADAIFESNSAAWMVHAASAGEDVAFNDSLLGIAIAYLDLVEAHGRTTNARVGLAAADEMVRLTTLFESAGAGNRAEVERANAEREFWRQRAEDHDRQAAGHSARLARLLRMDPYVRLVPVEETMAPVTLIDPHMPLEQLVAQGLGNRPELAEHAAMVEASNFRACQEHWRPWLPNVQVGASGGLFGGGPGSQFTNQSDRADVDLLAVWELQNLGLGNSALYQRRSSQARQAEMRAQWIQDGVMAEISVAATNVSSYHRQIQTALAEVNAAGESYQLNLQRVAQGEGLPLELLQAVRARISALDAHTKAVAGYNRAQYQLVRAVGRPPQAEYPQADSAEVIPEALGDPAPEAWPPPPVDATDEPPALVPDPQARATTRRRNR